MFSMLSFVSSSSYASCMYNLSLSIVIIGSILSMIPLIAQSSQPKQTLIHDDNYYYGALDGNVLAPTLGFLYVVLVPLFDIIVEFPGRIYQTFFQSNKKMKKEDKIVRLNDLERFMFIVGIASVCIPYLMRNSSQDYVHKAYVCVTCFSYNLTAGALLCFLQRCSSTFSPFRVLIMVICTSVGAICGSILYLFLPLYQTILFISSIFFWLATAMFSFLMLLSVSLTLVERMDSLRVINFRLTLSSIVNGDLSTDDGWYELMIPAIHMISAGIILWLNSLWFLPAIYIQGDVALLHMWSNATIVSALFVLVTEMRVRKNEVLRGLVSLLNTKAQFVRYISHELRTPLSVVLMGLNIVINDIEASTPTTTTTMLKQNKECLEILHDAQSSCTAAGDIPFCPSVDTLPLCCGIPVDYEP